MTTYFSKLTDRLINRLGYQRHQRSARHTALEVSPHEEHSGRYHSEDPAALCEAASQHVWVHKAIAQVSATVAGIPFKVWREKAAAGGSVVKQFLPLHPLAELMGSPNPNYTGFELTEIWIRHLMCTGMSFSVLEDGGRELWPLHPARVRIVPDRQRFIRGYIYEVGGRSISFEPEEVLYLRLPDPRPGREFYGLGPVAAARLGLALDLNAVASNQAFFENGARPFMALEVPGQLSQEQFDRLRGQWSNAHQGVANAKKVAVLEGGVQVKEIGLSSQDMEWIALRKLAREEILSVLGVPPIVAGLLEGATYANSDQQRQIFVEHLETMFLRRLGGKMTVFFQQLGLLQPCERCGWDTTELKTDALGIDRRTLAAQRAVQTALMSPNEARRIYFNLPPYDTGDKYFAPLGSQAADEVGLRPLKQPGENKPAGEKSNQQEKA